MKSSSTIITPDADGAIPYVNRDTLMTWAGPMQMAEGRRMFESGVVKELTLEGNLVRGLLAFGNRDMLTRFAVLRDGSIENRCPCRDSRERGLVCAHAMALGFAYVHLYGDNRRDRETRMNSRRERHVRGAYEYGCIRRSADNGKAHQQPATLRVKLEEGWRTTASAGAVVVSVWVFYRDRKVRLERAPSEIPFLFCPEHERLLYILEDMLGVPVKGPAPVTVDDFIELLEETPPGTLFDGDTQQYPRLDHTSLTPMLITALDEATGELVVTLDHGWTGAAPGSLLIIPGRKTAWAFHAGLVRPLASVLPRELEILYRAPLRIARTKIPFFLRRILPALEQNWLVEQGITEADMTWSVGDPVFTMVLSGDYERMTMELRADYAGLPGPRAGSPETDPPFAVPDPRQPRTFIVRNMPVERDAVTQSATLLAGFRREDGSMVVEGAQAIMDVLARSVPVMKGWGWPIEFEGWLEALKQGVSWIVPEVDFHAGTGGEWLDCTVEFRDSGGEVIDPVLIRQALAKGEACVRVGEKVWLMDRSSLQTLHDVLDECDERGMTRADGARRLGAVHAGYLQHALDTLSQVRWRGDEAFAAMAGRQNRSVSMGVEPLSEALEAIMRGYQKEGVSWLRFLERCGFCGILADEMGLGKTVQALAWLTLERINPQARAKPSLVVCPTSLLENWVDEVRRFTPDLKVDIIRGQDRKHSLARLGELDVAITSYALLRRDIEHYVSVEFAAVILDEAQHIKNHSTQNARAAKKLRAINRLVLTGTPVENGVADLWSILDFLMPGYLGNHTHFRRNYEQPIAAGLTAGQEVQQRLRQKVHPFLLRRLKRDVVKELPDRIDRVAYCTMTTEQRAVYRQLLEQTTREVSGLVAEQGFVRSRFTILRTLTRLRQACCHLALLKMPDIKFKKPSGKLDLFMELLDEAMDGGHRVLVFSQFVSMLHLVRTTLQERQIPFCYLDGSTVHRWDEVQKFNGSPDIPLFLISLKAGGTGLNLTGADMVIHLDPWWNPAVEDQATDRAHRIGQQKTVYNVKLITRDSIEEKVLALQQRKRAIIDATLAKDADLVRSLSWEDVQDLLRL